MGNKVGVPVEPPTRLGTVRERVENLLIDSLLVFIYPMMRISQAVQERQHEGWRQTPSKESRAKRRWRR